MAYIAACEHPIKDGAVVVRTATIDDVDAIHDVIASGSSEDDHAAGNFDDFLLRPDSAEEWIRDHIDAVRDLLVVAVADRSVVGVLFFHGDRRPRLAHTGELSMAVQRARWRRGIGRALLATLIEWAEDHPQIEKLCLSTTLGNRRAVELYRHFGFRDEGRRERQIKLDGEHYADEILMGLWVAVTAPTLTGA
jgi:RimJ/RimL family protein N-acetyltransferase